MGNQETNSKFHDACVAFLKSANGEKIDMAAEIYRLILEEPDKGKALRDFLENADEVVTSGEKEIKKRFPEEKIQKLKNDCEAQIEGSLTKLIRKNMDAEEFYEELWQKAIEHNSLLDGEDEKIYALYRIWTDSRIPYFNLGAGLKMSDEDFLKISETKKDELRKIVFILNSELEQRTETSSLILNLLNSCETNDEKVVLLAQVIAISERRMINELLSKMNGEAVKR